MRRVTLTSYSYLTQLAIDYGVKFLETSAKSSLNVEEVSKNVSTTKVPFLTLTTDKHCVHINILCVLLSF